MHATAVMLPSKGNSAPAMPADSIKAVITERRKSMCAGVPKKINGSEMIEMIAFCDTSQHASHTATVFCNRE